MNVLLRKYGELPDTWQIIGFDDSPISREAVIPTSTVGQQISVIPPILIRRETTA